MKDIRVIFTLGWIPTSSGFHGSILIVWDFRWQPFLPSWLILGLDSGLPWSSWAGLWLPGTSWDGFSCSEKTSE